MHTLYTHTYTYYVHIPAEETLKMVLAEPDLESDPCFRMPPLGQPSVQKRGNWEDDQEQSQVGLSLCVNNA